MAAFFYVFSRSDLEAEHQAACEGPDVAKTDGGGANTHTKTISPSPLKLGQ